MSTTLPDNSVVTVNSLVPHEKLHAVNVPRSVILLLSSFHDSSYSSFLLQLPLDSDGNGLQFADCFSTPNSMGEGLQSAPQ